MRDIATSRDFVYWAASRDANDSVGSLYKAAKCGGPVVVLQNEQDTPSGLLVRDGYLYYGAAGTYDKAVKRIPQ